MVAYAIGLTGTAKHAMTRAPKRGLRGTVVTGADIGNNAASDAVPWHAPTGCLVFLNISSGGAGSDLRFYQPREQNMSYLMRAVRPLVCLPALVLGVSVAAGAASPKLVDTHIHYSHDAWERLPPPKAIEVLKRAGLERAFVSSSSDEGTQKLYALAPELIVPVLRPYRARGETSSWKNDETVIQMLETLLAKGKYAGIGEFHAFGQDIELPVLQAVVRLAKQYGIFLHAHSDKDAVERIFKHDPDAVVLWAHSGFDSPDEIRGMLEKHPNLWSDLAYRSDHHSGGTVDAEWLKLFEAFPERFMLGTDTFAPELWFYVEDHAKENRAWLSTVPPTLAKRIGSQNALELLGRTRFGKHD